MVQIFTRWFEDGPFPVTIIGNVPSDFSVWPDSKLPEIIGHDPESDFSSSISTGPAQSTGTLSLRILLGASLTTGAAVAHGILSGPTKLNAHVTTGEAICHANISFSFRGSRYESLIAVVIGRINTHRQSGGILEGCKFEPAPSVDVEGQRDFPIARMWLPTITEVSHPTVVDGSITLKISLSTSVKEGLVEWMRKVETLLDAIELDERGVDTSLHGKLAKPMLINVRFSFATDLSLNAQILVTLTPNASARAGRRLS